ncbi:aspartate kinase [Taurinivorans muris]|uniref:Aspartokinase n=1 Tax=Taurinivorans muris TaxID=2787751 RepID=A0ABY5XZN0_9BACT|nr:aspartate kinase [Desulfovibrionaceae bacterium LT0009]
MKVLVQKFGGSSVADLECMKKVRAKVLDAVAQGYKVVVVLSARAGQTNKLVEMAYQWSDEPNPAEYDALLATGEQESIALFSMLLNDAGVKARSMVGYQVPVLTDNSYGSARIISIEAGHFLSELERFDVVVMAGFQGYSMENRITTLGRGGSDTSAVAIAAALSAEIGTVDCHIYTDVDGVYTTDPRMVPKATKIPKISYDEMLEMASMGAKVLQIRSVEFAKKYKVPVWVRSTFTNDEGTLVTQEDESMMESVMVSGVAFDKDQVRITILGVPDQPGVSAALFAPLADHEILVDMIVQKASREGITDMTYTVSHKDLKRALVYTEKVAEEIGAQGIEYDDQVAKVSVIGVGMRNHSGVAAIAFSALHKANINILMISTSEIKISCLIHANELEKAVRTLHTTFGLDGE